MSEKEKKEEKVFSQEVSKDELESISGGGCHVPEMAKREDDPNRCVSIHKRDINEAGCAATVESGSFCYENDACFESSVVYNGMKDCRKAWK